MTLLSPDLVAGRGGHLQLRVQTLCRDTARPLLHKTLFYHLSFQSASSETFEKYFQPNYLCVDEGGNAGSESMLGGLVQ